MSEKLIRSSRAETNSRKKLGRLYCVCICVCICVRYLSALNSAFYMVQAQVEVRFRFILLYVLYLIIRILNSKANR